MSNFGYVERKVADQMDWSVIGRSISEGLAETDRLKREKVAAIEQSTNEFMSVLENAPQGEHRDANQYLLDYSNDGTQAMLLLNKQLKSGELKAGDYVKKRQALMDSTNNMFALGKEYQDEYKAKMDLYNSGGDISMQSIYEMSLLEGLANFTETKPYIDPNTYQVTIGKRVLNPETGMMELSKNPADYSTVNAMRDRLKSVIPKAKVEENTAAAAAGLGKEIRVLKQGGVLTLEDAMQKPEYIKAEDDMINSYMVNPVETGSILIDFVKIDPESGQAYTYTQNPEEAGGNVILMETEKNSGRLVPKLTEEQENVAKEALRTQIRSKLDRAETATPTFAPPRQTAPKSPTTQQTKRDETKSQLENFSSKIQNLYTGKNLDDARSYLNAMPEVKGRGVVQQVNRTGDGVEIIFDGPRGLESFPIPFVDGNGRPLPIDGFVENVAKLFYPGVDVYSYIDRPIGNLDTQSQSSGRVAPVVPDFETATTSTGKTLSSEADSKLDSYSLGISTRNLKKEANAMDVLLKQYPDKVILEGASVSYNSDSKTITISVPKAGISESIVLKTGDNAMKERKELIKSVWEQMRVSKGTGGTTKAGGGTTSIIDDYSGM
jgi:outer membrane protein assembly factor BamD (BamD/ComL family)